MRKKAKHEDYPWERWISGSKLSLMEGIHFNCAPYIMAQQFRNKVRQYTRNGRDLSVSIKIDGKFLNIEIKEVD